MAVVANQDKCKCFLCRGGYKCDSTLLKEARAELAVAKEDTADLDWLERVIGYDPLQIAWNDDYRNCWSLYSKQVGASGKTLREAIRKARCPENLKSI